jgi:hypothetical protein
VVNTDRRAGSSGLPCSLSAVTRRAATTTRQTYVVEHYRPGLSSDELRHLAERVRDAVVDMGRAGKAIRCLSSTVVPEDEYFQSVLEATSERLVREAHARAGISFERISAAIPIDASKA